MRDLISRRGFLFIYFQGQWRIFTGGGQNSKKNLWLGHLLREPRKKKLWAPPCLPPLKDEKKLRFWLDRWISELWSGWPNLWRIALVAKKFKRAPVLFTVRGMHVEQKICQIGNLSPEKNLSGYENKPFHSFSFLFKLPIFCVILFKPSLRDYLNVVLLKRL